MKAKELLEILQKLDPETLIVVDGYEGDYCAPKGAEQIHVTGPHNDVPWYYGGYKDHIDDIDGHPIKALHLTR
mgnify:CR=1 FL=1